MRFADTLEDISKEGWDGRGQQYMRFADTLEDISKEGWDGRGQQYMKFTDTLEDISKEGWGGAATISVSPSIKLEVTPVNHWN